MKKLSISSFKQARIATLAELDIRGGIDCGGEVDDVVDWLADNNIAQLEAICDSNPFIQCQNADGSFGTHDISGDCPYV